MCEKDFSEKLSEKFAELGDVTCGVLGKNEGKWVGVQVGLHSVELLFDMSGEKILSLHVTEDIYKIVDQKALVTMYNETVK